jgi:hypothetical protein
MRDCRFRVPWQIHDKSIFKLKAIILVIDKREQKVMADSQDSLSGMASIGEVE